LTLRSGGILRDPHATDHVLRATALPALSPLTGWSRAALTLWNRLRWRRQTGREDLCVHEDCCGYECYSSHEFILKKSAQHST
jgi:hypothetical protein